MYRPVPLLPFLLITGCAAMLALLTASSARRGLPRPVPGGPAFLVRYSPVFRWTVAGIALLVPAGVTIGLRYSRPVRQDVPLLLAVYLLGAALFTLLVWEAGRFYLLATPTGLEGRSPWRGVRVIPWDEVDAVRYQPLAAWFEIRGLAGQTIRVPTFAAGLDELLRRVEAAVPPGVMVRARPGYDRLGRPFPALPDEPVLEARPPRT
jgi:hypothetical protein